MTSHLSIVREWQANCSELMTHTNDEIVPVIRSALEVIHAASRTKYEPERADRANAALREHIQKTMGKENGRKPLRVIYFGLLESLLVAMEALAKKRQEEQRFLPVESPSISVVDLEEELLREPFIVVPDTVRSTDDEEESQSASVDRAAAAAAPMLLTVKTEKKSPDELASINWGPSNPSAGKKEKAPEKTREGPAPPPVEVLMEQTKNNEKERERAAVEEEEEEEMDVVVDAPEPKRRGRPPKSKKTGRPKSSGVAPILAPLLATTLPPSSTFSPPPSSSSALTVSDARRPKRVCSQSINFAELNKGTAAMGRLKSPDATRKISRQRKASKGRGIPKTTEANRPPKPSSKGSVAREAGGVAKRPKKITGSAAKDAKRARVKEEPEPEHEPEEREQSMGYAGSVYSDSGLMNCLLCALGMDSVRAYVDHLRTAHKTTATLEGIWFRCECGHMCRSNSHEANKQPQCGGRRSTIMLDGDEDDYEEVYVEDEVKHEPMDQPEREDASAGDMMEKEEQEEGTCTICKVRPRTISGYINHLRHTHRTTLIRKGRLLYCACGWGIRSARSVRLHNAKRRWCDGRSFRVARLADEPPEPEPAMSEPELETNEDREEESSTDQSDWNADSTNRDVVARMEAGEDPGAGIETGAGEKDGVPGEEEEMVEDDDESSGDALLDGDDDGQQPKCFLCEDRPSSIMDFILHLYKVHDSTLGKFGYALQCDCGHVVHSQYAGEEVPRHTKTGKCAGHKFRIKKVPEEAEAQEDEREEDDEAPGPSTGPPPGPLSFANFSLA